MSAATHLEHAALAAGSMHERHVHINVNRLVNRACGLGAGQRGTAAQMQQSLLVVAQTVAAQAMHGAHDHRDGYARAKAALQALSAIAAPVRRLEATDGQRPQ